MQNVVVRPTLWWRYENVVCRNSCSKCIFIIYHRFCLILVYIYVCQAGRNNIFQTQRMDKMKETKLKKWTKTCPNWYREVTMHLTARRVSLARVVCNLAKINRRTSYMSQTEPHRTHHLYLVLFKKKLKTSEGEWCVWSVHTSARANVISYLLLFPSSSLILFRMCVRRWICAKMLSRVLRRQPVDSKKTHS